MRYDTLADWLQWLESLHSQEIDLGLDRVRAVADNLQLLEPAATVITVAGTNGKGSCVTAIESVLAGTSEYRVGTYTSPHFLHYCERIRINGSPVSEWLVIQAFDAIDSARDQISLTYFEFATLAALWVFRHEQVDVAVLEVGLGGRLDAVNIIDAHYTVITPIDIDHSDWLGDTREKIGFEKAGIMRSGRPCVCADSSVPDSVLAHAEALQTPLLLIGRDYSAHTRDATIELKLAVTDVLISQLTQSKSAQVDANSSLNVLDYLSGVSSDDTGDSDATYFLPSVNLPLPSIAAAAQVLYLLDKTLLQRPRTLQTLTSAQLTGRFQRVDVQGRHVILDVAHNPAATDLLAQRLSVQGLTTELPTVKSSAPAKTHMIMAAMADKDLAAMIEPLIPCAQYWYAAGLPGNTRAASHQQLTDILRGMIPESQSVFSTSTVGDALEEALRLSQAGDTLVVFGSFFTVAATLSHWQLGSDGGCSDG